MREWTKKRGDGQIEGLEGQGQNKKGQKQKDFVRAGKPAGDSAALISQHCFTWSSLSPLKH